MSSVTESRTAQQGPVEEIAAPGLTWGSGHVATATMGLLHCRSAEDVYRLAGDFMARLVPDSIVVVNEATPRMDGFITRHVSGLDGSSLSRLADLLGFEIVGMEADIRPALRSQMLGGTLSKIHGGVAELASRQLSRRLVNAGARLFGIRDVFGIGIADEERALANCLIFTRTPDVVLPTHAIESFAHHCFSALSGIIRERELVETSRRNELLLSSMIEGLAVYEIILDEAGKPCDFLCLEANPALETMMGMKAEDMVGRTRLEVQPDADPSLIERYGAVALTGEPVRFEACVGEAGKCYEVVVYSPQQGLFAVLLSDITERKQVEEALRERTELVETLLENAPIGFAVNKIDDGQRVYVSRTFERIYGVSPDSMNSVDEYFAEAFVDSAQREEMRERIMADLATEDASRMRWENIPITTQAGERKVVTIINIPLIEQNLMISTVQDMSAYHQAQHALRESEEQYRSVVDASPDGIAITDLNGVVLMVSSSALNMFGFDREEELLGHSIADRIVPADRDRAVRELALLLQSGNSGLSTWGALRRDGGTFDVEVSGDFIRDADAQPAKIVFIVRDVTERNRSQKALISSESRSRAIFEHAPLGIALIDSVTGRIEDTNPMYARIMGRTREELSELDWMSLTHPDDVQASLDEEAMLDAGESAGFEAQKRYIRPDGSTVWANLIEAPVQIGDEAHPKYVAIVDDITADRQVGELLARQRERIDRTLTSVIDIASNIGEARDPYTAGHQRRVAEISVRIAQDLGMSDMEVADIKVAGLLHDVGKVAVPAEILAKPGRISHAEFDLIKAHAEASYRIVVSAHLEEPVPEMILQHHERLDGSGYPRGLVDEQILMGAKVLAVADVVEAMMSDRPYRPALGIDAALAEIERGAGRIYDTQVSGACIALFREGRFESS